MSPFPHDPSALILGDGSRVAPERVFELLGERISLARRERIEQVVAQRTYSIISVCDNLYDTGNMAAVMRSAEAMGIQEFHSVQLQTKYKRSKRVTAGSHKWLDIHIWDHDRAGCIRALRERGYRILATQLSEDAVDIGEIDFTAQPTAIVFGNEHDGVSQEFLDASDARCILPMLGFAESYNISVAAALSFYHVRQDRMRRQGRHGDLSERERTWMRANFWMRALSRSEAYLEEVMGRLERGETQPESLP